MHIIFLKKCCSIFLALLMLCPPSELLASPSVSFSGKCLAPLSINKVISPSEESTRILDLALSKVLKSETAEQKLYQEQLGVKWVLNLSSFPGFVKTKDEDFVLLLRQEENSSLLSLIQIIKKTENAAVSENNLQGNFIYQDRIVESSSDFDAVIKECLKDLKQELFQNTKQLTPILNASSFFLKNRITAWMASLAPQFLWFSQSALSCKLEFQRAERNSLRVPYSLLRWINISTKTTLMAMLILTLLSCASSERIHWPVNKPRVIIKTPGFWPVDGEQIPWMASAWASSLKPHIETFVPQELLQQIPFTLEQIISRVLLLQHQHSLNGIKCFPG